MRYVFKFPDIGEGIHEGKVLEVYVRKGQAVEAGQSLVKVETDKVVTDIPSPRSGTVAEIFARPGEVIQVEAPLVEIDIPGVSAAEAQAIAAARPAPPTQQAVDEAGFGVVGTLEVAGDAARLPASTEGMAPAAAAAPAERPVLATPVARAMARELGVDIRRVRGSGPGGRVTRDDVRRHRDSDGLPTSAPAAADDAEARPLSQMRKAIARNMSISKQTAAHMTVFEEVEVSALVQLRRAQRERLASRGVRLTYLPFFLRAAALALRLHPTLNSQLDLDNGQLLVKKRIHIGIAVDTPEGLVVPVVRDADKLTIVELAEVTAALAEKARQRGLTLDDLRGGTFTLTNYGSIAGTYGVPVIHYPQAAILGVGRIMDAPVVRDGAVMPGRLLPLSLSVDHRIVDGGEAARFMLDVTGALADPAAMLLG